MWPAKILLAGALEPTWRYTVNSADCNNVMYCDGGLAYCYIA